MTEAISRQCVSKNEEIPFSWLLRNKPETLQRRGLCLQFNLWPMFPSTYSHLHHWFFQTFQIWSCFSIQTFRLLERVGDEMDLILFLWDYSVLSVVRFVIGIINQSWCDCWSPWKTPSAIFWKIACTSMFLSFTSVFASVSVTFLLVVSRFSFRLPPHKSIPTFSSFLRLRLCLSRPVSLSFPGQRNGSGAGSPAFEWADGGRSGAQAAARSVSGDLCPGHGQHASTAELPGSHERFPPWGPVRDFVPPRGSWGRPRARTEPPPPSQQFHSAALHALQTPGAQRRPFPPEPRKDTYAHLLPGSARGTHPRSHWSKPWDLYLSQPFQSILKTANQPITKTKFGPGLVAFIQLHTYKQIWRSLFFQYRYIWLWDAEFPCLYIFVYNERQQWSQSVFWIFMIFLKLSLKDVIT